MKIAIAQICPVLGDPGHNLIRHLELAKEARTRGADIIIFPELSLTGYTLRDLVPDMAITPGRSEIFNKLVEASREIEMVVGFVEEMENNPGLFYNSAAYLSGGKILHLHRKVFLPTSGMFEEGRFFAAGKSFKCFSSKWGRIGLLICRDFLHLGSSYCLMADGASLIITISAAPGRGVSDLQAQGFETSHMWELMGETIAFFSSSFVVYCNRVGVEDGATFAGGSFIYSPFGKLITKLPYIDESLLVQEIDLEEVRKARKSWPFRRDERPEVIWQSLEKIIRGKDEDKS